MGSDLAGQQRVPADKQLVAGHELPFLSLRVSWARCLPLSQHRVRASSEASGAAHIAEASHGRPERAQECMSPPARFSRSETLFEISAHLLLCATEVPLFQNQAPGRGPPPPQPVLLAPKARPHQSHLWLLPRIRLLLLLTSSPSSPLPSPPFSLSLISLPFAGETVQTGPDTALSHQGTIGRGAVSSPEGGPESLGGADTP